jgi:hypothetical protein
MLSELWNDENAATWTKSFQNQWKTWWGKAMNQFLIEKLLTSSKFKKWENLGIYFQNYRAENTSLLW